MFARSYVCENNIVSSFAACEQCHKVATFDSCKIQHVTSALRKYADSCRSTTPAATTERHFSKITILKACIFNRVGSWVSFRDNCGTWVCSSTDFMGPNSLDKQWSSKVNQVKRDFQHPDTCSLLPCLTFKVELQLFLTLCQSPFHLRAPSHEIKLERLCAVTRLFIYPFKWKNDSRQEQRPALAPGSFLQSFWASVTDEWLCH